MSGFFDRLKLLWASLLFWRRMPIAVAVEPPQESLCARPRPQSRPRQKAENEEKYGQWRLSG
jgi:hypothetical protein